MTRLFVFWLALLVPAALLGGALISEHVFGLYPCEMCMWQRWPHMVAILLAICGLALRNLKLSKLLVILAALAVIVSGLIGGFHAGVEYGWWEGITGCASNLADSDDLLGSIMDAPLVRCDVAPWSLFGISLAGYNFLLSVTGGLAILAMALVVRKKA